MSVLQRVTGWLTGKNNDNAQAAYGGYHPRGYYGSAEAQDAYGSMAGERAYEAPEESFPQDVAGPAERFDAAAADPYNGRVPYRSQQDPASRQDGFAQGMQQDLRHRRTEPQQAPYQQQAYQQPPYQQAAYQQPQESNVVNFPGQQTPSHVEYVMLLRSRNECTKVIEYIKTSASVFLNMEYIANESERQRCVDMLSGAAYTLGCQLHKISNRGIYLIASPNVRVMIDPAMKRFTSAPEAQAFSFQQAQEVPPQAMQPERPFAASAAYAGRMSEQAGETTAPYPPQQQAAYAPFQRPRPTFRSQQQAPLRRASGAQYADRQAAGYPSSF